MDKGEDNIEYIIEDKKSYSGDIDSIKQKNPTKKWISQFPCNKFQFKVKLKSPSRIGRVQIKGNQTEQVELQFLDLDSEPLKSQRISLLPNKSNYIAKNIQINALVDSVIIRLLTADSNDRKQGLNFILFKGSSTDYLKQSKPRITNLTKEQVIKLDSIHPPVKSKPGPITSTPYGYLSTKHQNLKSHFNQRTKRMDKPKQQVLHLKKQNKMTEINIDDYGYEESDTIPLAPQRMYQIAPFNQMSDSLQYVNTKWIEAQRRIEEQLQVREEEKLSNYLEKMMFEK